MDCNTGRKGTHGVIASFRVKLAWSWPEDTRNVVEKSSGRGMGPHLKRRNAGCFSEVKKASGGQGWDRKGVFPPAFIKLHQFVGGAQKKVRQYKTILKSRTSILREGGRHLDVDAEISNKELSSTREREKRKKKKRKTQNERKEHRR